MSFFQKNKSTIIVLLMAGFLVLILSIFFSGIGDSNSDATATSTLSQQLNLATSTGNVVSTPRADATPILGAPSATLIATSQVFTEAPPASLASPSLTVQSSVTEAPPNTDAPPPVDDGPPGTDFPPPLTFVPPPTETPPPGNGPPPGS